MYTDLWWIPPALYLPYLYDANNVVQQEITCELLHDLDIRLAEDENGYLFIPKTANIVTEALRRMSNFEVRYYNNIPL